MTIRLVVPLVVVTLAAAGCESTARPVAGAPGSSDDSGALALGCTSCHGDADRQAAPLVKAAPATGAHLAHLGGTLYRDPVGCETCHPIATSIGHANGAVELSFGGVPAAWGPSRWNDAAGTCTTYCHGSATPAWTGGGLDCASCHGNPPAGHDPTSTTCSACHPGTVLADGAVNVSSRLHLNGTVEVEVSHAAGWSAPTQHGYAANASLASCRACHGASLDGGTSGVSCNSCHGGTAWQSSCTFCHGDATRASNQAAPPAGTQGETATTTVAVGAHAKHLSGGAIGAAVACTACHAVPTGIAHVDGTAAVTFGAAATRGGLAPAWNGSGCASTYCHGATISGGTNKTPSWTGGASQASCGTCHGVPPPAPHTASTSCESCHEGYTATTVNAATHLDGTVQSAGAAHAAGWATPTQHGYAANANLASCRACHGASLDGGTSGVSCNTCHGGTSAWQSSCTFCHGDATRASNQAAPPVGTQGETATTTVAVGAHAKHLSGGAIGAAVACTECHLVPAGIAHVDGTAAVTFGAGARRDGAAPAWNGTGCASTYCHGATISGGTNKTPSWTGGAPQASCGTCHGVPPPAPHTTSTSCESCHEGYTATTVNAATHLDGAVQVQAGGGHAAGWADPAQHGHEANRAGLAGCKSCHGADLAGGSSLVSCNACHGGTAWQTSCTFCHGGGASPAPPVDTQGRSVATNVSVGVHASHVATTISTPIGCGECHPARSGNVVADVAHLDGDGRAEIAFGALARTGGRNPVYARASETSATCASTYCHGGFTGGANATMSWTGATAVTCTSCHGAPPSSGEHGRSNHRSRSCGDCHGAGYSATAVVAATHVNGSVQTGNRITSYDRTRGTCTNSCHDPETW
jgi:predicted CxxxxCH...CXXCH cytochrome family protein